MSSLQRELQVESSIGPVPKTRKRNAALSCAECRRLKLRCDRKFPCSACVKRGCGAICPDGSLTTGKGNRFVLASTEVLHEKILELSTRVRELEDALAASHSNWANEPHPLLRDDLLRIKNPLERDAGQDKHKEAEEEDVVDAVGSLSISHTGRASFYGQTANAWYLLQNEDIDGTDGSNETNVTTPTDIPFLAQAFPFVTSTQRAEEIRGALISYLPSAVEARRIADTYYENAAWMYDSIPKAQFDETIFRRIYGPDMDTEHDPFESHRLAVLFMVLAFGSLLDTDLPSRSPQALQYYQLSRAALSLDSVLDQPSVPAIQALLLMCHYLFLSDIGGPRWTLMGIVVKLAQSIGLHRDSTRWNLDADETQKRRELMWEIYVYDSWQSLTYGRPPSFSKAHIDCKMPFGTTKNGMEQVEMSYAAWKHKFCSDCLSVVQDKAFGARSPSYATVLDLDKKVRNYYVPPSLQVPGFGGSTTYSNATSSLQLTMQRHIVLAIREVTMLYLHRGFFARAMDENPEDPLGSKYGSSVLSAHRSASSFVALVHSLWSQYRVLTERMWFLFTHVFSCAILLGSIPTKCPSLSLARSALQSLDQAYEMFTKITEYAPATKVLPVLSKLRDRAHLAMSEYRSHSTDPAMKRETFDPVLRQDEEELATLTGKTRFVSPKVYSSPSPSGSHSTASGSSPEAISASPYAYASESFSPMLHQQGSLDTNTEAYFQQDMPIYTIPENVQQNVPWQGNQHQTPIYTGTTVQEPYPMDVSSQSSYPNYDYVAPMRHTFSSPQLMLQQEMSMTPTTVDMDASWRNYFAQFNSL